MKNLIFLLIALVCSLFLVFNVSAQCQGNVYITSLSWQSANSVHGFTSTELDFCSGLYYDPANYGSFEESYGTGTAILGMGYTQGYGDTMPAVINFDTFAPISNGAYTTSGNHYVIAYYQAYIPVYYSYYWYDPFDFGFSEIGGGDSFYYPDDYGYWGYATYWASSPQFIGTTSNTISYAGQTFCLPGQQFTSAGQPCSSLPGCESGLQFSATGVPCPGYVPPAEPPNDVGVAVVFHDDHLRPNGTTDSANTLVTTCVRTTTGNISGIAVALKLEAIYADSGHAEEYHYGKQPLGTIGRSSGFTNTQGCFQTTYFPSHISGRIKVKATISGVEADDDIWVLVNNLVPIESGSNHRLNGSSSPENCDSTDCTASYMSSNLRKAHPSNHWVDIAAKPALIAIANDYKAQYYGNGTIPPAEMVTYNDASLRMGGKFDLRRNWRNAGPHEEHREGKNIDTKSLNIPSGRHPALIQIFRQNNFGFYDERDTPAPHFHLRLSSLNQGGASDILQNGIDPNINAFDGVPISPSDLASNAADAIFERSITQGEFESWHLQLSNAKIQGTTVFLNEVKMFYQQLFESQEYTSRLRNDGEFVADVFASHLLREPTQAELSYWTNYLLNLGGGINEPTDPDLDLDLAGKRRTVNPSLSQSQRRQMFLTNFETMPQFVNLIGRVVNDKYAEPVQ